MTNSNGEYGTGSAEGTVGRRVGVFWIPVLLLLVVHAVAFIRHGTLILDGGFNGTDSYSRMVQVGEWHRSGDWYQEHLPRSNMPHGERRTWSRPFDLVLLLGAIPLSLFMDFEAALHAWAVAIGPVLHLATLIAFLWAMTPLLSRQGRFYAALMLLVQASIVAQFLPAKPDHHSFQALLFVLLLGLTLRLLATARSDRACLLAALVASLALWTSVESLVPIAVVQLTLVAQWLSGREIASRPGLILSVSIVIFLVLALMVERPPESWFDLELDRLSIAHLALFSMITMAWLVVLGVADRTRTVAVRAIIATLLAASIAAVLWFVFPAFFAGPMAAVPERVVEIWNTQVAEYQSALDPARLSKTIYVALLFLGPVFPAAVYLPFLIARSEHDRRRLWLLFLVALLVFLPLSLYQLRWGLYAQLLALPVYAELLLHAMALLRLDAAAGSPARALGRVGIVLAFAGVFVILGYMAAPKATALTGQGEGPVVAGDCDAARLGIHLERVYGDRQHTILTLIFLGPEILYRTSHGVVATPNHRNADAIMGTIDFFSASPAEDGGAHELALKRDIDLVLVCPGQPEAALYAGANEQSLYQRLVNGLAPAWLRPIPLPDALGVGPRLYEFQR